MRLSAVRSGGFTSGLACRVISAYAERLKALARASIRLLVESAIGLMTAELAACKALASGTTRSCLSTVRFDAGPKRAMGHVLGAEKNNFLNSRY